MLQNHYPRILPALQPAQKIAKGHFLWNKSLLLLPLRTDNGANDDPGPAFGPALKKI
jgi:hypothetical protein